MPPPLPDRWLIDTPVVLVYPDGTRRASAVQVGYPDQLGSEPGNYESNCWVRIDDVVSFGGPVIGGSTFGALLSALECLRSGVEDFILRGGRILDPDGEDMWSKLSRMLP